MAPHIHTRNNKIWVRKHNKCDLASLETIEHLLAKRDRSSEIRQKMSQEVQETVAKVFEELRACGEQRRYHMIGISPLYPFRTITFNKSMDDFLESQVSSVGRVNISTPRPDGIEFRFRSSMDNTTLRFFSISRNASLINIEPLKMRTPQGVYIERVVQVLTKMLRASVNIFEQLEYFGKLSIEITVGNVQGLEFQNLIPNTVFPEHYFCQKTNIEIEDIRSLDEVKEQETEILHSIYNKLLRSFEMSLETAVLDQRLDWLLRHLP